LCVKPNTIFCANLMKMTARAGKGAGAETVTGRLVEDPVFSGDLARKAENRGNLGRPFP